MIYDDELIIIDGIQGVLIINPDQIILDEYKVRQQEWLDSIAKLYEIRTEQTITKDGIAVDLYANIDGGNDINEVIQSNAAGVGLYRSEFLFLAADDHLCSEDDQFEEYVKIAKAMNPLPVIIRTADLGADKNPSWNNSAPTLNPALGLTGIRLSLAQQGFFRMQLRALLRASHFGNVHVMFPMISSSWELKQVLHQLEYAKDELENAGVEFNRQMKIGVMIEVPSAALAIKSILSLVDFVSIGTNDLLQYLLAMDRDDEAVNYLYNPLHPAVLKILLHIIRSSNRAGIPVSICGEMAGEINLVRLLLGMGLRKFSMHPGNILKVKRTILNTNLSAITNIVSKILKTENIDRINELVNELNSAGD